MNFRVLSLILVILVAALSRLVPHSPNFTPIIAMGLFSGFYFRNNKTLGFAIVMGAMLLSDIVIGTYSATLMFFVYFGFAPSVLIGIMIPNDNYTTSFDNVLWGSLGGSIAFFLISNFGVFITGYPKDISGLIACYTAAIPFFHNTLSSSLIFSTLMFLCYDMIRNNIPQLKSDIA